jgi:hypothetical protein
VRCRNCCTTINEFDESYSPILVYYLSAAPSIRIKLFGIELSRSVKLSYGPINRKAELVVQDTASYQKLIELAERAERIDALRLTIQGVRNVMYPRPTTCLPKCRKSSLRSLVVDVPRRRHRYRPGRCHRGIYLDRRAITRCRRPLS